VIELSSIPWTSLRADFLAPIPSQVDRVLMSRTKLTTLPDLFFSHLRNKNCAIEIRDSLISKPEAERLKAQAKSFGLGRVMIFSY
jgi:hypothetical protein